MNSTTRARDRGIDWRRLRKTPLRDLLRGRVTGRLDAALLARDADLPAPLADAVGETARRTRLLRLERAEVARELIGHFLDGLDAGRTPEELLSSFGDRRTAARLIGRAKRRDRGIALKLMLRTIKTLAVFLLVMTLLYAALAARYLTAPPGPVVDYLPRLNAAALSSPEDARAWPIYREALLESDLRDRVVEIPFDARPGWSNWPATAETLRELGPALARVREGAGLDFMGFAIGSGVSDEDSRLWPDLARAEGPQNQDLLEVLMPHAGEVRRLAGLLSVDARLALTEGDGARAADNTAAMLSMAEQIREIPLLISDLVSVSIASMAFDGVLDALEEHPEAISDDRLGALAHRLAAFPRDGQPMVRLSGERLLFEDAVQRMYTLDSNGDGRIARGGMQRLQRLANEEAISANAADTAVGPLLSALTSTRKEALDAYHGYMDRRVAWAAVPAWKREPPPDDLNEIETLWERMRHALVLVLTPEVGRALLNGEQLALRRDAALTAIALELHRRRHAEWPSSLEELSPALMPRVPIDHFTGEPLKYVVRDGRPVLYSVGSDYIDDGGTIPEGVDGRRFANQAARWMARANVETAVQNAKDPGFLSMNRVEAWERAPRVVRGDWILYPAAPRREPAPSDGRLSPLEAATPDGG